MWFSRLFWKWFISYVAINLVATITFVLVVSGWQRGQVVDQVKKRLRDSASLVRSDVLDLLPLGRTEQLQQRIALLGAEIGTRITVVDNHGLVLADSQRSGLAQVAEMENHKDRVELVQAAARGEGVLERKSPTLGEPMLYFALRADRDGAPLGLIRTAVPMTSVHAQVSATGRLIWLVAAAVSFGVMVVTYFLVAAMLRPIRALTQAAEAIAAGDLQHRVYVVRRDELGALAKSFNRMSGQLTAREAELRESGQRFAGVLEGMVEGVIAVDQREQIIVANAAAGKLLGFVPDKVQGRRLLEAVRNHALHQAVIDVQITPHSRQLEIEIGVSDKRTIAVNASLVSGEPSPRVVLVLQDVTELRQLEVMRQEFVANVSHELKTPLSSIKAYAETLSHGAIHDETINLRFVQQIEEQAERLHQLILDLISLGRIESHQQAFEIVPVEVSQVVQSCLDGHRRVADTKKVTLKTDYQAAALRVLADEEGLKQMLDNLVDNAVNYTSEGGQVTVRCRQSGTMGVIEVQDTGIGIASEHLPRVFERFYRVDKARSRELGGTGLGLSIVKHLAQSFKGNVSVASRLGEGSCFTILLPLA